MSTDLRDLIGKRVTAKRSGWDVPDEGVVTDTDILYPPPWRDEGQDEDVDGVLAVAETPAGPSFALVGGQPVDPATVRPAGGKSVKHGPAPKPGLVFDESSHRWVKPGEAKPGGDKPSADEHTTTARGLAAKIKAYGQKAVDVALTVGAKAYELGLKAQYAVMVRGNLSADDIADTAHDYSKIINAKAVGDPLSTHLGISGNTAAVVASHIVAYGITKFRQAAKKRGSKALDGQGDLAEAVADLLDSIYSPMGVNVTADEVRAWLASR